MHLDGGVEWIVDAWGCDPAALRDLRALRALFARAVEELGLTPVAPPVWHEFPGQGGVSGLLLLAESHLACHTFPEAAYASLNLYCCRPRPAWDWQARLRETLGAARVQVRALHRGADISIAPGDTYIGITEPITKDQR
jgi:S-adenosylmethionine decarboxylase